jgi:DNA polymerase III subunit gamma/tau
VRALLGMFSLESLEQVSTALGETNSGRMLQVVDELERNGHNLQHFSRELARYFRNLLVARIAGAETRLVAASPAQKQKLAEIAQRFSEQDLTRYLQLSLDLFHDLQFSLQPRFHLELGLVRLVQAGRLMPIEEALAQLEGPGAREPGTGGPGARGQGPGAGGQASAAQPPKALPVQVPPRPKTGPSPFEMDSAKKAGQVMDLSQDNLRERLHAHLMQNGLTHLADAVEHSLLSASGSELQITTAKTYKLYLEDRHFEAAVKEAFGKPMRINIKVGETGAAETMGGAPPAQPMNSSDDATTRALANEEVRRFREVFGGDVRKVRNLKE